MKKFFITLVAVATMLNMQAQPPADSTPKYPSGATKQYSSGTNSLTNETLSSSTQYYNVVQVTKGSLTLDGCTLTKTGDGTSGDNSSVYGTNSAVYASGSEAVINMTGGTITTSSQGANAIFATNGATINVSGVTIDNSQSVRFASVNNNFNHFKERLAIFSGQQ